MQPRYRFPYSLLLCLWPLGALAVPDANGNVTSTPAPDISADAAMSARLNYNIGFDLYEKARAAEGKAAREGFVAARTRFESAVKADPNLKEGWNLIGYSSRRLGEYQKALDAYGKALALDANYAQAIEYRAEAYLGLNRIEDAKAAYMTLFASAPAEATVLLDSMKAWVDERRAHPAGVSSAELDALWKWVQERASVAQTTAAMRPGVVARSWN